METRRAAHPTPDVLKAFGLGKLDDSSSGFVVDHLDQCDDCRQHVAALSSDDFLDRLRQAQAHSSTPAPAQPLAEGARAAKPPASQTPIPNLPPELAANQQYEILRELGRGGMGVVYLAKNKLMDRLEVLKVINKALLDRPGAVERFLREIRSAAKLSHVNVMAAYHALQLGEVLAFAMEYIEGEDLASVVKSQGPLPIAHACFYVQQAARGLQHAFEKHMVHRDIKPQNLILARQGRKHIVKVLDFGLAKATSEKRDDLGLTGEGRMLGTPEYIAPEQSLDAAHADIRADIYSLGCTLYFLLSGRPPFRATSLSAMLLAQQMQEAESLNRVRPEIPEELASVVRKMMAKTPSKRYQTPLEVVQALAPFVKQGAVPKSSPELSMGTAKAAGVPAVKTEVPPVPTAPATQLPPVPESPPPVDWDSLTDGVIAAPKPRESGVIRQRRSTAVQPGSWKGWLMGGGLAAGLLLLGLLGYWLATVLLRVETANGTLLVEMNNAEVEARIKNGKLILSGLDGKDRYTLTAKDRSKKLEAGVYQIRVEGADGLVLDTPEFTLQKGGEVTVRVRMVPKDLAKNTPASLAADRKPAQLALDALKRDNIPLEALALAGGGDAKRAPASLVGVLGEAHPIHYAPVLGLAYSPDGRWLASGSVDKTIMLRDAVSGEVKRILKGHTEAVSAVAFSKDSRTLLSASYDGSLRLWSVDKDEKPLVMDTKLGPKVFQSMAVSSDGRFVAAGGESGLIKLWKWGAWEKPIEFPALTGKVKIRALALSPDGELLACGGEREANEKEKMARVRIYATADGSLKRTMTHRIGVVLALSFSHDGKHLASVGGDGNGRVWEVASGKEVAELGRNYFRGEWPNSFSVAWSPDDKMVAVGSHSQVVVYDPLTGTKRTHRWDFASHIGDGDPQRCHVRAVAFSPQGNLLAAGGNFGDVPVWDTTTWKRQYLERGHRHFVRSVAFSRNGPEILSLGDESALLRWQLLQPRQPLVRHLDFGKVTPTVLVRNAVFSSRDGKISVMAWPTGIAIRDTVTEKETVIPTGNGPLGEPHIAYPAMSPDARILAVRADSYVYLWDLAFGRQVHRFPTKGSWVGLAFSGDGKFLASCNEEKKRETIWNVTTGDEVCSWEVPPATRVSAFHPNGKILATGHEDGSILLWDSATGQKKQALAGHAGPVRSLKFTPDGKNLVSSGNDGIIRLWNPEQPRAREIIPLGPANRPLTFDLDPSGKYLFAAGHTPVIFILRLP